VWYGLCVTACALGTASKEVMVSAPLMVLLYDRTFVSGSFREAWRRRWPLYLALASTWILLGCLLFFTGSFGNAVINAEMNGTGWWEYLLTEPGVILYYLRLAAWPYPLCFDYYGWSFAGTGLSILYPMLVIAILLGATAWTCKTNSAWGVLGAWFFLILAPSSSFIPTDSLAYEHRMYLPLVAVVVLAVMGIHALAGRRTVIVTAGLTVTLGFLTTQRNEDYSSDVSIWSDTVAKRPDNVRAQYDLGNVLTEAGRTAEAIDHYQQALRIKPDVAKIHSSLGNALLQGGRIDDAIGHYEQALRIQPNYVQARYNLGNVFLQEGKVSDAIGHYEEALRIKPDYAEAHNNLGVALWNSGKLEEAIGHFQQAVRIKPDYVEAYCNLGDILGQTGRVGEAIRHFEQALRIKPDYAEAHYDLGIALEQTGKLREAIGHYQQALRIKPDLAEARTALTRLEAGQ
jgi:tetratricopeptide (TPR) repeat protein